SAGACGRGQCRGGERSFGGYAQGAGQHLRSHRGPIGQSSRGPQKAPANRVQTPEGREIGSPRMPSTATTAKSRNKNINSNWEESIRIGKPRTVITHGKRDRNLYEFSVLQFRGRQD